VSGSPRQFVTRLGLDQLLPAQKAYRAVESARCFWRGYQYGRRLPDSTVPIDRPDAPSALEEYADAHVVGPGMYKWRHYFDVYDRHLSRFRGRDTHLVEIGVAGGGSLGMWRDYLGPEARITGVDVDPECKRFAGDAIEIVIGDQGDSAFWRSFLAGHSRIDVLIDDGGHLPEQQVVTLESVLPAIQPGGVYICEDIHGPFQPFHAYIDGLTRPLSAVEPAGDTTSASSIHRQIASVHRYPIMTVIEKTAWTPIDFESGRYGTEWPAGRS
jgi:Methyltransferase domain